MTPPDDIASDIRAVGRIDCVPAMLRIVAETTGMGFAAIARVTDDAWVACAVHDELSFGLVPGGSLDIHSTLCKEVRACREPIVIDHVAEDPRYATHHTPRIYGLQSYVSVPIVLRSGEYFGNLCAIDPRPARVSDPRTIAMFERFADLIALQLESDRAREQERRVLLDEREAGELREQFIAVLGHDLRNPLSAVVACGDLLTRKSDAHVVALGERILVNSNRMAGLIADTLDFTRGRLGGGLGATLVPVADLAAALRAVVDELRDAHPARRIIDAIEPVERITCDRGRVQQLASNLVANALQHGAADRPVTIIARTEGGEMVMKVHNEGDPIEPYDLTRIFAPYGRRLSSRPREGLGLGLYISAQIVQAHGGRIAVDSSRDAGTTFVVHLPLDRQEAP